MSWILPAIAATLAGTPVAAQLGVPGVGLPPVGLPDLPVDEPLGRTLDGVTETADRAADRLLRLRTERLDRLLRAFGRTPDGPRANGYG